MFLVYILYSSKLNRYYIGTTNDVERRLIEHNTKVHQDAYTSRGIPWELYFLIDNLKSEQAYQIEAYLKRMKSSVYLSKLKQNPEIVTTDLSGFIRLISNFLTFSLFTIVSATAVTVI